MNQIIRLGVLHDRTHHGCIQYIIVLVDAETGQTVQVICVTVVHVRLVPVTRREVIVQIVIYSYATRFRSVNKDLTQ